MARDLGDGTLIVDSEGRISAAPRAKTLPDEIRALYIVVTLLLIWVHVDPFHDLTSVSNIEASDGGNKLTQIVFSLLGLVTAGLLYTIGLERLRALATLPALLTLGAFGASILFSVTPALSLRRAILLGIAVAASAAVVVLARNVRQFANLMGGTALVLLGICYVSLLVVPDLAMHTALDLREPEHAGSWRGFFAHKNEAGAAMAVFVFTGLYVLQVGNRILGVILTVLSAIFLAGTMSKTPIALMPLVLLGTASFRYVRGRIGRALILFGPLVLILTMSVGSIFFEPIKSVLASVTRDVSFTGRTAIWEFAVEHIARRPLTGWGYGAFWKTDATLYGSEKTTWVNQADQAHNAYVDVALVLGLPGLVFTLLLFWLQPFRDLNLAAPRRPPDPSSLFFTRVWIFGLMTAAFESIFYDGNNSLSFMLMMSIFGLRFMAHYGLAEEIRPAAARDAGVPPPR